MPKYISPTGQEHTISTNASAVAVALSDTGLPITGVWPDTYRRVLEAGGIATVSGPLGTGTIIPDPRSPRSHTPETPSTPEDMKKLPALIVFVALFFIMILLG